VSLKGKVKFIKDLLGMIDFKKILKNAFASIPINLQFFEEGLPK
jgi:hypothetical protein